MLVIGFFAHLSMCSLICDYLYSRCLTCYLCNIVLCLRVMHVFLSIYRSLHPEQFKAYIRFSDAQLKPDFFFLNFSVFN